MARFDFEPSDEFVRTLEKLENFDKVAEKILKATAPILVNSLQTHIGRLNKYSWDGELRGSITAGKIRLNSYGYYIPVGPARRSKDSKGVYNGTKLAYLEYGTSKMAAHPTIDAASKAVENQIIEKMQQIFEEEAGAE